MNKQLEHLINQDNEHFKELFFEKLESITNNSVILEILDNLKHERYCKEENFDKSKYIETQLYNIGGKEYMIDMHNGIVFGGKRADIIEVLTQDELKKLKEDYSER